MMIKVVMNILECLIPPFLFICLLFFPWIYFSIATLCLIWYFCLIISDDASSSLLEFFLVPLAFFASSLYALGLFEIS